MKSEMEVNVKNDVVKSTVAVVKPRADKNMDGLFKFSSRKK